jgi:Xaa-Pro dipeptidase
MNMERLNIKLKLEGGAVKYPAKSHARRVALATAYDDALILVAGEKSQYYSNSDQKRHFRQDRYFYYLTGCNEPDCYVTYDVKADVLTLWLPRVAPGRRVFYDGRGSSPDEALKKYDIDRAKVIPASGEGSILASTGMGPRPSNLLVLRSTIENSSEHCDPAALRAAMDTCRAVKDADEIILMRRANGISSKAHREVLEQLRHLKTEAEVEGLFIDTCVRHGAHEQAYEPIVGSGKNASTLHYINDDEAFGKRSVLLIDASCEYELYASDITRTMPLNTSKPGYWPSKECETVYKAVQNIQEEIISMIKPGVTYLSLIQQAASLAIDALQDLGVLKGDPNLIISRGTYTAFAPHAVGHHIGLEVHDAYPPPRSGVPKVFDQSNPLRNISSNTYEISHFLQETDSGLPINSLCTFDTPPLEPGNTVTIEPGLYFNKDVLENYFLTMPEHKELIDEKVLQRYMHVGGVRIEDCILVTADGYENLTTAPKGEEMLEIIRGERS